VSHCARDTDRTDLAETELADTDLDFVSLIIAIHGHWRWNSCDNHRLGHLLGQSPSIWIGNAWEWRRPNELQPGTAADEKKPMASPCLP
jgi:hypothetical protein